MTWRTGPFETDQVQAMALLSIKMLERAFDVALVFFGFHCLAIGWLIYRSGFLPPFPGPKRCALWGTLGSQWSPRRG